MWPFFVLWDFWFWSLFGVFIIFEFVWASKHNGIAGIFTPFLFMILLAVFSSFNPFSWISENWSSLWLYILGYVGIGVVWSFFHWIRFVQKRADFFGEFLDEFRKSYKTSADWFPGNEEEEKGLPKGERGPSKRFWERLSEDWSNEFRDGKHWYYLNAPTIETIIPQATDYKDCLVSWMSLWPFDMVWMLLSDLLIELWNWLFARFRLAYQKISDRAFRKYVKNLSVKKEEE